MGCMSKEKAASPNTDALFYHPSGRIRSYNDKWYNCREFFHADIRRSRVKYIYFALQYKIKAKYVAEMIDFVEEILNLKPKYCSEAWRCNGNGKWPVIRIAPSKFWLSSPLRFQFFTALLKTANLHATKKRHGLEVFQKGKYFPRTCRSTAVFLCGYTIRSKSCGGWVVGNRNPKLTSRLSRPLKKESCKFFESHDSRSNLTMKQKEQLRQWVMSQEQSRISKNRLKKVCPFKLAATKKKSKC